MILFFADRYMHILGQASSELPEGLRIDDDLMSADTETGVNVFEGVIQFTENTRTLAETCVSVGHYIFLQREGENEFYTIIDTELDTQRQEIRFYAEDAGLDLLNERVGAFEATEDHPLAWYVEKFAYDSGFEIGINEAAGLSRKLAWDGEATVTERLASVATQFGGFEISYSFVIEGLTITRKIINIYKKRGKDIGITLRLNEDIDRIVTSKSIADLATALECTGGVPEAEEGEEDTEEKPPITLQGYKYDDGDIYVSGTRLCSRSALEKWSRYVWNKEPNQIAGEKGHIVRQFTYDTTEQSTLCAHAITELKKVREIAVNYEVDIAKLPKNVSIGDRVNIVDDKGGLYLSTRLLKLEKSECNQRHAATLGEYLIKSSGISQKVIELAEAFKQQAVSVQRATSIASNANKEAVAAKENAAKALLSAENAQKAAGDASAAAVLASGFAELAEEKAGQATDAVGKINESITGMQNTVKSAQEAAANAAQAAQTAKEDAQTAKQAAENAAVSAGQANAAAGNAQIAAGQANTAAQGAKKIADRAIEQAGQASQTAADAKADAAESQRQIDTLGEQLTTVSNTMQADYARKTDLSEAEATLTTKIEQNAAGINLQAKKTQRIDETTNNAAELAQAAFYSADQAAVHATAAQAAADEAAIAAETARTEAEQAQAEYITAQAAADEAEAIAVQAENDLLAAEEDLAAIYDKIDATAEEIAAAEQAVANARTAATLARTAANGAAETARAAQETANAAVAEADNAQADADHAMTQALIAQEAAKIADSSVASAAMKKADEAGKNAAAAQQTAAAATETATAAQATADEAAQSASASQAKAEAADAAAKKAADDLDAAKEALKTLEEDVNATTQELEAARQNVATAQAAADEAAIAAETARTEAEQAQADADAAQAAADEAQAEAAAAQIAAQDAAAAAIQAKKDVNALSVRVTNAETNIKQNADAIELTATKEEVTETLGGYYTRDEANVELKLTAEGILAEVSTVKETADGNEKNIEKANTMIQQLANEIKTLVVGENGESLMIQTETGWKFDFATFKNVIENHSSQLAQYDDHIHFTTYEDEPCVELGEESTDFRVLITNKRIMFCEGANVPTYICDNTLVTENIMVKEELQHGAWVWQKRANGNLGLSWKGVFE